MKPMRGVKPTKPLTDFPYLASPKIDGLRAVVKDGVVLSKTLKPIPNRQVQRLFGHLHSADGELTIGPAYSQETDDDVYDRSRGILMTSGAIADADVRFHVFDRWDRPDQVAHARVFQVWNSSIDISMVSFVSHQLIQTQDQLDAHEAWALGQGYEGLMLRRADAPYKYGQSTEKEGYLLKIKRFNDAEAIVLSCKEQMANTNAQTTNELGLSKRSSAKAGKVGKDTFGAFLVRDLKTGVEFEVGNGPGLTHAKRDWLWQHRGMLPGLYITYTYQQVGTKNAPRLPQFKNFRSPIDMSDL